jgi:hypothetical protein
MVQELAGGGQWIPPIQPYAKASFDAYIDSIMKVHEGIPDIVLHDSAFSALDKIRDLCKRNGAELFLLITPNHPYDDYRWLALGYWPLVEQWVGRISLLDNVLNFSRYGFVLGEKIEEKMEYWYDPIHFSSKTGKIILDDIIDIERGGASGKYELMSILNAKSLNDSLRERKQGLDRWKKENHDFVRLFDARMYKTENDPESRRFNNLNPELVLKKKALRKEKWRQVWGENYVEGTMRELEKFEPYLFKQYPDKSIKQYDNISNELAKRKEMESGFLEDESLVNAWSGRLVVQVFPAGAWGMNEPATYNIVFEGVTGPDCRELTKKLTERPGFLRINIEPSGHVSTRNELKRLDSGCVLGANSVGYTFINSSVSN